jgi:HPt (histidine-containing phosphotransfer) domain-containing protein
MIWDNKNIHDAMTLLNVDTIATFRELMDEAELSEFLEQAARLLDGDRGPLLAGLRDGQWETAARLAHRLKGGLGSLGCDALYARLAELEKNLKAAPPLPPDTGAIGDLDYLLGATLAALQQAMQTS